MKIQEVMNKYPVTVGKDAPISDVADLLVKYNLTAVSVAVSYTHLDVYKRQVYTYAFGECGAVQCGFCIPGMIISAKVLIDENNDPTPDDVKKAILGNICRCTGYVKIEEGIMLAAKMFRENLPVPEKDTNGNVGARLHRVDAEEKALGTGPVSYTHLDVYKRQVYGQ